MQKELLKIAAGVSMVAEALTVIAKDKEYDSDSKAAAAGKNQPAPVKGKNTKKPESSSDSPHDDAQKIGIEDIRAVLAEKSQDGKSKEVKSLLNQYGVAKLSAVEEKDYPGLLQKARAL